MKVVFTGVSQGLCNSIKESIAEGLANCQYEDRDGVVRFYQHVNTNQSVTFNGSTVVVEGERCALWGDHHAQALRMLSYSGIEPSKYETSDTRLKWYETLRSFMEGRAPYEMALKHCRETQSNPQYYKALEQAWEDALRLQQYPLRASAEMDKQQLERAREVLALL